MEEDSRKLDRTWLCSVLFLDIVNYSSEPVETQVRWKAFFNSCLSEALRSVLTEDRIILDTGDGAVVCFLGDPEAALLASLSILGQFRAATEKPAASVRIGINLGPIRLIRDINNHLNAVGDGINVGQRIMSFAAGNHLLISRSYYEVISTLSDNYKSLFRFDGVRHDKHVREHTVYALVQEDSAGKETSAAQQLVGSSEIIKAATTIRPEDLAAVEKQLSSFVGPIAAHLVKKTAAQANSVTQLCQLLCEASVPPGDRATFLKRCKDLLGSAATSEAIAAEPNGIQVTTAPPPPSPKSWDEQFLNRLRKELAEFVGPIAGVLVGRAAKTAGTQDEMYTQLALQITSERERQKFLASRK